MRIWVDSSLLSIFLFHRKLRSYEIKKPSGQERTAAERNYVARATRRRRRILQAGFFLILIHDQRFIENPNRYFILCSNGQGARVCFINIMEVQND